MRTRPRLRSDLGGALYFLEGEEDPSEVVEITRAPRRWNPGDLRPRCVPIGYFLTEITAGRLEDGLAKHVQHQVIELGLLAMLYLSEPGQEPHGTADTVVRWHREQHDPFTRYRGQWDRHYKSLFERLERGEALQDLTYT